MAKKVAVLPSKYLPWKGYFDLINQVDSCFIYENGELYRTTIKTPDGLAALELPVHNLQDTSWAMAHWEMLEASYARSPRFREYAYVLYAIYQNMTEKTVSRINYIFIRTICDIMNINTPLAAVVCDGSSDGFLQICQHAGATCFLHDPAQKVMVEPFTEAGIQVATVDFSNYPPYEQLYPPFEHQVSMVDLLFSEGIYAPRYLKSF